MPQDKFQWIAQKAYNSAKALKKSNGYNNLNEDDKFYIQCMVEYIEQTIKTK